MWKRLARATLSSLVQVGTLHVTLPDGSRLHFGNGEKPETSVTVTSAAALRHIIMSPEMGVGEAYVDGTLIIENDDLYGFVEFGIRNLALDPKGTWLHRPLNFARTALRRLAQFNPVGRAQRNVAHHYDLSGELYDLFLDKDRQYSCAYFRTPSDSLEKAQENKKHHIAGKLRIEPGMSVLDIGCGWGGMALTLAREYGARVVGVTLSREQHAVATRRVREAGLQDRIEIRLQDYRHVTETFDRVVSVGMFEHVGVPHYNEYFAHVREFLEPDGIALIHTIGRADEPGTTSPWITKYIFPGGYCPSMSEAMAAVETQRLFTTDVEVWRLHYAETLRHWHDRFMANIDKARALYDDRFCRMWRYYLIGSELTFRYNRQVVFQFQLTRDQAAVPLTRDYLYEGSRQTPMSHAAE